MQRWAQARQFEDAMNSARERYQFLFTEVYKRLTKKYPEIKERVFHRLSERVAELDYGDGGGSVGFSNPKWPRAWNTWPSGIWLSNVSLDELVSERAPAPSVCIWLGVTKRDDKRIEALRRSLFAKCSKLRGCRFAHFQEDDPSDNRVCLWYELPEQGPGLLQLALRDDGQAFVDCVAHHVEVMAGLAQGLDNL
jgi:hypothetical protein